MTSGLSAMVDGIWLVPGFPLLVAAIIGLRCLLGRCHGDASEPLTARLSSLGALGGLILLLAIDLLAILQAPPGHHRLARWFGGNEWEATVSFMMDPLALAVSTTTALIAWLVMRFSANYLHREAGFHRFFLILNLFLAGIQIVFLSGNGLLAFVGWEMCGIASFLLIGYARHRPLATGNALFAFVANRAGDAGFLLALGLAAAWLGSFEWTVLSVDTPLGILNARLLAIGFVLAAMAKSAQLPFSPWILRALEGPTPSSAIFYGAVMVHAGVFLMIRLEPLLSQVPDILFGLVVVGVLTAFYAWLCGLVQTDVKSALMYASLFQVALMFVEIGMGWTWLATVHLCLHAAWRTWHFLLSPSWLMLTRGKPSPAPAWLQRSSLLYTVALQRFWLDKLAMTLLVEPTMAFARDLRNFEEKFIARALGEPGHQQSKPAGHSPVVASGLPGRLLASLAELCQRMEDHLLLRGRGGAAERMLQRFGGYLRTVENLLEQPRYLMMAVMATIVVIL